MSCDKSKLYDPVSKTHECKCKKDHIYLYTQLEYSNDPIYGKKRSRLDSLINTFYLEYSNDRINIKLGDLYELYGRGMCCYTLQNQAIDYNNSIKGLNVYYYLNENIKISSIIW